METIVVLAKPDAVRRKRDDSIKAGYTSMGFRLLAMKKYERGHASLEERFKQHYAEHEGKHFYSNLIDQMKDGPVIAYLFEITNGLSIEHALEMCSVLRKDYAEDQTNNSVHCSDNAEAARREAEIWGLV